METRQDVIDRGGARIAFEISGEARRPTVLLGHSLLCDRRMWAGVVPMLAARFQVVNVEVRGHGRSTAPGRFSLEDLAEDWRAVLDHLEVERAVLCGLSMGGMTALRLALLAPERASALLLLDSSADAEPLRSRVEYRALAEIARLVGSVRSLEAPIRRAMFGATSLASRPEIVERGMTMIREQDPRQLYPGVRAVIDRRSIHARLPALRCPVRVLCGEEDHATPPERSRRLAEAISGATLRVVPQAGHLSVLERPDELGGELTRFIDSLPV